MLPLEKTETLAGFSRPIAVIVSSLPWIRSGPIGLHRILLRALRAAGVRTAGKSRVRPARGIRAGRESSAPRCGSACRPLRLGAMPPRHAAVAYGAPCHLADVYPNDARSRRTLYRRCICRGLRSASVFGTIKGGRLPRRGRRPLLHFAGPQLCSPVDIQAQSSQHPNTTHRNTMSAPAKPEIVCYLKTFCGWSEGVRAIMRKYGLEY